MKRRRQWPINRDWSLTVVLNMTTDPVTEYAANAVTLPESDVSLGALGRPVRAIWSLPLLPNSLTKAKEL